MILLNYFIWTGTEQELKVPIASRNLVFIFIYVIFNRLRYEGNVEKGTWSS